QDQTTRSRHSVCCSIQSAACFPSLFQDFSNSIPDLCRFHVHGLTLSALLTKNAFRDMEIKKFGVGQLAEVTGWRA
ncbi:hypothetical protein N9Z32_10075, partial [Akkermansiaceae bacterium]|nr:hypothetical protein [Akkermansiaceae bacterium]